MNSFLSKINPFLIWGKSSDSAATPRGQDPRAFGPDPSNYVTASRRGIVRGSEEMIASVIDYEDSIDVVTENPVSWIPLGAFKANVRGGLTGSLNLRDSATGASPTLNIAATAGLYDAVGVCVKVKLGDLDPIPADIDVTITATARDGTAISYAVSIVPKSRNITIVVIPATRTGADVVTPKVIRLDQPNAIAMTVEVVSGVATAVNSAYLLGNGSRYYDRYVLPLIAPSSPVTARG